MTNLIGLGFVKFEYNIYSITKLRLNPYLSVKILRFTTEEIIFELDKTCNKDRKASKLTEWRAPVPQHRRPA